MFNQIKALDVQTVLCVKVALYIDTSLQSCTRGNLRVRWREQMEDGRGGNIFVVLGCKSDGH